MNWWQFGIMWCIGMVLGSLLTTQFIKWRTCKAKKNTTQL